MFQLRLSGSIILLLFISFASLNAQNSTFFNAQQLATADNSSVLTGSSALFANPAASLSQKHKWDMSIAAVNLFSTDIFGFTGAANYKTNSGAFGLTVAQYGIDGFQSSNLGISFAKALGKDAFLGLKANWFQRRIEGIDKVQQPDFTLGYWQKIDDKFILSFYIKNPMQKEQNRVANGKIHLSLAYAISEQLHIFSSLEKPWNEGVNLNPGLKYSPSKIFSLYMAASTNNNSLSFGTDIGINDQLLATLALKTNTNLGNSAGFSLQYRLE